MNDNARSHPEGCGPDRAQQQPQEHEDLLVAALRQIMAEVDPVPPLARAVARAAFATRDLDAELAVLIGDSDLSLDDGLACAFEPVRTDLAGVPGSRLLAFAGGGVQVDLEVSRHGDQLTLAGQLTGASGGECVLEHACGGRRVLQLDSLCRFLVGRAGRGPVRLRCRSAAGARVVTAWVAI